MGDPNVGEEERDALATTKFIYRSDDGGVSWQQSATVKPRHWPQASDAMTGGHSMYAVSAIVSRDIPGTTFRTN